MPSAMPTLSRAGSPPVADRGPRRRDDQASPSYRATREICVAAVRAYVTEMTGDGCYPGLTGYERVAAARGWPSRTTVCARLGPWAAALRAAGLDSESDRRPSRQDCVLAVASYVEELAADGRYPGYRGYQAMAPSRGWPGGRAVLARLGPWSSALRQAGFARPQRSGSHHVTREECIAAVTAYVAEATSAGRHPGVAGYDAVQPERGWPQRQSTVMARLGSWSAALLAAGYADPLHQRRHRISRSECLAAVRAYLAEMSLAGETPSLAGYGKLASSRGWPAVATMLARLGSWQHAARSAAQPLQHAY
jgi:hypothetical protein